MTLVPNEKIAAEIVTSLLQENVIHAERMTTGNQNYVYALRTKTSDYVLRLTTAAYRQKFAAALYWQERLLPLGVPLAKFIHHDIEARHSPFPALLMERLPGSDIGNVYPTLNRSQKKNLAEQMTQIHQATRVLPDGAAFGYALSYEKPPNYSSWFSFLWNDLEIASERIKQAEILDQFAINQMISIADRMRNYLSSIRPQIFMPDTTVKNVIVHEGKLSGIVDIDEMCFGDPLFVLSLTYAGSEIDGHDTHYADCWKKLLSLSPDAEMRLEFYQLLHTVWFMGECSVVSTSNGFQTGFNIEKLRQMYQIRMDRLSGFVT